MSSSSWGYPTVFTLTAAADTVSDTNGNALIVATNGTLSTGDSITPTSGDNSLLLSGAGVFDLTAPTALTGVGTVIGDNSADQTITLPAAPETLLAGNGNDTIHSLTGTAHIVLGNGTDVVTTGTGATTVQTGTGNDSVASTGAGALTVVAGAGVANITFGSGSDVLKVEHGTGTVTVSGFTPSTDTVDLSGLGISSYTALQSSGTITASATGSVIALTDGPTIDLLGVTSLSAGDFTFSGAHSGQHFDHIL